MRIGTKLALALVAYGIAISAGLALLHSERERGEDIASETKTLERRAARVAQAVSEALVGGKREPARMRLAAGMAADRISRGWVVMEGKVRLGLPRAREGMDARILLGAEGMERAERAIREGKPASWAEEGSGWGWAAIPLGSFGDESGEGMALILGEDLSGRVAEIDREHHLQAGLALGMSLALAALLWGWARWDLARRTGRLLKAMEEGDAGHPDFGRFGRGGDEIAGLWRGLKTLLEEINGRESGLIEEIDRRRRGEAALAALATRDPLTGLPNRAAFGEEAMGLLERSASAERLAAVAFLDLDGFKELNDERGHEAGDRLLREVGARLKEAMGPEDAAYRIGGDEFALALGMLEGIGQAEERIGKALSALSAPFLEEGWSWRISASAGYTVYPLDEARDADELLRHADQAMYEAKRAGGGAARMFEPDGAGSLADRETLQRVERALAEGRLELHYQPKVDMGKGEVIGAEALLRMRDEQGALVPPGKFLPAVEASDWAIRIDEWVIERALADMEDWRREGLEIPLSVNITARHLQSEGFGETVRRALDRHPLAPPAWLELEIVESAALSNIEQVRKAIRAAKGAGAGFALDDFGMGYSSLSYLKMIPADTLKIDQSFVRDLLSDPDDFALVKAIGDLARSFGKGLVAEGVETEEQGLALLRMGIAKAQGYRIAKPMPKAEFGAWARAWEGVGSWGALEGGERADRGLAMMEAWQSVSRWTKALAQAKAGDGIWLRHREVFAPEESAFGVWIAGEMEQAKERGDEEALELLGRADVEREKMHHHGELCCLRLLGGKEPEEEDLRLMEAAREAVADAIQPLYPDSPIREAR